MQYDDIGAFYEGLAWVYKDGEEFYINKQGQRVD
ncbi:WG repeat-containing protein [Moraxella porci]